MNLNSLLARIMDLYILEYINLMPYNTTTIVYSGAVHSRFLFNELIIFDGYNIIELELENINDDNLCNRIFPSTDINIEKLYSSYLIIKKMYDDAPLENKIIFKENLLNISFTRDLKSPIIENKLGKWEVYMVNNPSILFNKYTPSL
jgi:hypothetical protein